MTNINFRHISEQFINIEYPQPAKRYVSKNFKNTNLEIENNNLVGMTKFTVKKCVPFLDAMTIGYIYELPANVTISNKNKLDIKYNFDFELVSTHSKEQLGEMSIPYGFDGSYPLKWNNPFIIKTPKGYSTLFISPMNNFDVPFICFSGVVDTDTYNYPINFPFLLRNDFNGTIDKGTPLIQMIPFKREEWDSTFDKPLSNMQVQSVYDQFHSEEHVYKKFWWQKKIFK